MGQEVLLALSGVNWRYEGSPRLALENIDLQLCTGEVTGIVGLSGAGKTTLLLTLAGLIPANYGGDFGGDRAAQTEIAIVFQDPETQFIGLTVEEEIAFSLEARGMSDDQIERRIEEVLELVGLSGFAQRSPLQLSGREKQRVAIASALAIRPRILLLDEPTSELDPKGTREVFALLKRLKQESEMAIVIASHAAEELAQFCDRMLFIANGAILYDQPTRAFFAQVEELAAHGIHVPDMIRLYHWLRESGQLASAAAAVPLSVEEMCRIYSGMRSRAGVKK